MARAFLVVMDSVGCGGAPDAAEFGDEGANTLGHIAQACAAGTANEGRHGPLFMPNLDALGLGAAIKLASGLDAPNLNATPQGLWGVGHEQSRGKDTPSGHWELAGVPVTWDWHYFPRQIPALPQDVVDLICQFGQCGGVLANCHAVGVPVMNDYGAQHLRSGWPICYTSTDSVLQIAAHEEAFGLERLYDLCARLAPVLHARGLGRVIARPFIGTPGHFQRTANRRDFAMEMPRPGLLDWVSQAGHATHAIGKIGDIFSMRGVGTLWKGKSDADLFNHMVDLADNAEDGALVFANFVEFDTLWGHPRDVAGYARALESFDQNLPRFFAKLRADDVVIFTADHGNDPTWTGTDHTREAVPILGYGLGQKAIGIRSFSDVAASVAQYLGVAAPGHGQSFL